MLFLKFVPAILVYILTLGCFDIEIQNEEGHPIVFIPTWQRIFDKK